MSPQGRGARFMFVVNKHFLHIYRNLSLTLPFFQWQFRIVSRCLTWLALLLSSKRTALISFSTSCVDSISITHQIPPFPAGPFPQNFSDRPLLPAAKVKPPASTRFALGPAGAQTQCSPLVCMSLLKIVWKAYEESVWEKNTSETKAA